jgi:Flp pilus assembly protein TadG
MSHLQKLPGKRNESGAALVEFTLVLPLLLLLVLGALDFGKAFNYWIDETHLAHEGARFAAVDKNPGGGATLQESIKQRANTPELESALQVCVSFPNGPVVGEPVEVQVTSTYNFLSFIAGELSIAPQKELRATSTMRLERPPTNVAAGCA